MIRLGDIAHGRSGDKGNHANIGVIAFTAAGHDLLRRELTAAKVKAYFRTLSPEKVERFELPKLFALNFVLWNALGGGASDSLRTDTQGKALATALLEMELPDPENLPDMLPPRPLFQEPSFRAPTEQGGTEIDYTEPNPTPPEPEG